MNKFDRIEARFLVEGDRFYFIERKDRVVYEVIMIDNKGVHYNVITSNGKREWMFDKVLNPYKPVVFVRHREPIA